MRTVLLLLSLVVMSISTSTFDHPRLLSVIGINEEPKIKTYTYEDFVSTFFKQSNDQKESKNQENKIVSTPNVAEQQKKKFNCEQFQATFKLPKGTCKNNSTPKFNLEDFLKTFKLQRPEKGSFSYQKLIKELGLKYQSENDESSNEQAKGKAFDQDEFRRVFKLEKKSSEPSAEPTKYTYADFIRDLALKDQSKNDESSNEQAKGKAFDQDEFRRVFKLEKKSSEPSAEPTKYTYADFIRDLALKDQSKNDESSNDQAHIGVQIVTDYIEVPSTARNMLRRHD